MGNKLTLSKPCLSPEVLSQLEVETELSKSSLKKLYSRVLDLDRNSKGYLDKGDLLAIPEVRIKILEDSGCWFEWAQKVAWSFLN